MRELRDVATVGRDLSHERRRDIRQVLGRREKHRFDAGVEHAVHSHELKLVFKVGHGTQAAQNDFRIDLLYKLNQQAFE